MNFLKIFSNLVKDDKNEQNEQNDETKMKDELPLVNEHITEFPIEMEIISISSKCPHKVGEIVKVFKEKRKTDIGFNVISFIEERGVSKLSKDGVVIKVKEKIG